MNIWKYFAIERRWPKALILVLNLPVEKVKGRVMKKSRREINFVPENESRARKLKSCRNVEVVPESWSREKKSRWCKKKMLRNRRWHYGGPQLSRQKKKLRGKRKRLTAKGRTLRQKGKDSRQKKKHHSKRKKPHGKKKRLTAKEKKPPSPYALFYAVRTLLFLSPWVFYLDKPDNDMRTNYLTSVIIAQCLQKLYLPITGQS